LLQAIQKEFEKNKAAAEAKHVLRIALDSFNVSNFIPVYVLVV